jgi:hypothetical protein
MPAAQGRDDGSLDAMEVFLLLFLRKKEVLSSPYP